MVDYLNGLQPQTALAVLGRPPKQTAGQHIAAASGGGDSRNDADTHPQGRPPRPLTAPRDPPTGPPPAFEANVLEVEAQARREGHGLPPMDHDDDDQRPAVRREWQGPTVPDPALINVIA